jgi:hypothetical protein
MPSSKAARTSSTGSSSKVAVLEKSSSSHVNGSGVQLSPPEPLVEAPPSRSKRALRTALSMPFQAWQATTTTLSFMWSSFSLLWRWPPSYSSPAATWSRLLGMVVTPLKALQSRLSDMPIFLMLKIAGVGAVLVGLFWLVDEIGDRREAKVWRKINAAIASTNVHIAEHESLDAKIAAVAEDARLKALADVGKDGPRATPEQAAALSKVK